MQRLKELMMKTVGLPLCAVLLCASGCAPPAVAPWRRPRWK
ncbi:hypothetical protein D187_005483 [Cystobacter fuscus DSM 2262]|uniref:Uncharacterized protein n=1 Tax=Cystobacter fuscus (strain ATCC 25194 / DSM 2262 / NBRC 100088 / M29) TaxID=1242864 RepID=S9QSR2_CYSF2|nr:hypothetical protein [Cystobacter fuscus]EPX64349.1 hypothetical protein D187_005483 [Cystobacter fuscus DSM 2262]